MGGRNDPFSQFSSFSVIRNSVKVIPSRLENSISELKMDSIHSSYE
jgi:hypothetical protein